jgi:hypothetical protein
VLIALTEHAMAIDDRAWLRRHVWWRALAYRLRNDLPPRAARRLANVSLILFADVQDAPMKLSVRLVVLHQ